MRKYIWYIVFPCLLFSIAWSGESWVSIYGPHRMELGGIRDISFPGTYHTQLESRNIRIEKSFTRGSKYSLVFDVGTTYRRNGQRVADSDVIKDSVIKESIHTYGVALLTYETASNSLCQLSKEFTGLEEAWSRFKNLHVTINPHDTSCSDNAFYRRTGAVGGIGELSFCFGNGRKTMKYFDIVSHEMGHAILDALQPKYWGWEDNSVYSALHESFADLMAYFTSVKLALLTDREGKVVEDLQEEELHIASGFLGASYIRNPSTYPLINPCLYKDCALEDSRYPCTSHNQSNHFTKFVMESMKQISMEFPGQTPKVIRAFQDTLILTAIATPRFKTLYDFGREFSEWGMKILTSRLSLSNDSQKEQLQCILGSSLASNVSYISNLCPKSLVQSQQVRETSLIKEQSLVFGGMGLLAVALGLSVSMLVH